MIKALLQERFSLTIFCFSQIIIDLQPLFVLITGKGNLHGFSHTYIGATLIALLSAFIGKPVCDPLLQWWYKNLSEFSQQLLSFPEKIPWSLAIISAFLGTFSHVLLDSIMHADMRPFYPTDIKNNLLGIVTIEKLHIISAIAGLVGVIVYCSIRYKFTRAKKSLM